MCPANDLGLAEGMNVTMSPYTNCGKCTACRQGRFNACRYNQTLGVQRDGALMDNISMPMAKLYAAPLPVEELVPGGASHRGLPCGGARAGHGRRTRWPSTDAAASAWARWRRLPSAMRA